MLAPTFFTRARAKMKCEETIFEPGVLMDKLDGDEGLARELLQAFAEDAPVRLDGLERALAEGNALQATEMAHSLKGMCGVVRVQPLVEHALVMEQAGRAGNLERLRKTLGSFTACLEQVLAQVRTYLKN